MTFHPVLRALVFALAGGAVALGVRAPRGFRTDSPRRIRASARLVGWDRRRGMRETRIRATEGLAALARPGANEQPT